MHLLSLTTDYGTQDFDLAYLKARLISQVPDLSMLDVSHEIPMDDLGVAAYQLRSAMPAFPPNAMHLVCVNEYLYPDLGVLVARKDKQWIIAPNNGFLYLLYDKYDFGPVEHASVPTATGRIDTLCRIVYALCHQYGYVEGLPQPSQSIQKYNINPIVSEDQIRTRIYHIDQYGNIVLNISQALFEERRQERDFVLEFRKYNYAGGIKEHIATVEVGELSCSFNLGSLMMISAFQERADELLDVRPDEIVNLRFIPRS